ncbi:MAG: hypothetical protein IPK19_13040 [Chloroflexi bacterium]|nr:hypothetical protein [Chloroflexota bacterium]
MSNGAAELISSAGAPEALIDSIDRYLLENVGSDPDPAVLERLIDSTDAPRSAFWNTGRTILIEAGSGCFHTAGSCQRSS